ncbi:hypothetical protein Sjap_024195 [Stephania japonica]|uniref:Uncharacterized protein n=1 Tax=Stephania japonica TaxID=461633 RepID=A0AAP0HJN0_9MAGN
METQLVIGMCPYRTLVPGLHSLQLRLFVHWFGWCTWDAFYTDVTTEGVNEGISGEIG